MLASWLQENYSQILIIGALIWTKYSWLSPKMAIIGSLTSVLSTYIHLANQCHSQLLQLYWFSSIESFKKVQVHGEVWRAHCFTYNRTRDGTGQLSESHKLWLLDYWLTLEIIHPMIALDIISVPASEAYAEYWVFLEIWLLERGIVLVTYWSAVCFSKSTLNTIDLIAIVMIFHLIQQRKGMIQSELQSRQAVLIYLMISRSGTILKGSS
jgi:hypothetical protein